MNEQLELSKRKKHKKNNLTIQQNMDLTTLLRTLAGEAKHINMRPGEIAENVNKNGGFDFNVSAHQIAQRLDGAKLGYNKNTPRGEGGKSKAKPTAAAEIIDFVPRVLSRMESKIDRIEEMVYPQLVELSDKVDRLIKDFEN